MLIPKTWQCDRCISQTTDPKMWREIRLLPITSGSEYEGIQLCERCLDHLDDWAERELPRNRQ